MVANDGSDGLDHSHSPPPDLFEFFPDLASAADDDMCAAADEIFVGWRLIPSNPIAPPRHQKSHSHVDQEPPFRRHRRSESLEGLGRPAAEYRRLRPASSSSDQLHTTAEPARPRPKWHLFLFWSFRVPTAMETKDMRFRQSRRGPRTAVAEESGGWRCGWPWRLIRSLSCKAAEGAVAPLALVSHARGAL